MSDISPETGAENLLLNCAKLQRGDCVLIAHEPVGLDYYDQHVVELVSTVAVRLGLRVDTVDVGFEPKHPQLTAALIERFVPADAVVFFARLGDQLRFSDMPPGKKFVVSYAVSRQLLGSRFSTIHYDAFTQLKESVDAALKNAREIRVTCPAGTEFTGVPEMNPSSDEDTSVLRFPLSIHTPVPARSFSGRVALPGFLTGTGSKYYDHYTIEFDGPVLAAFDEGRLTRFEGSKADIERAERHYDYVSGLFGIDRNFIHSWHAGIHPGCAYPWDMRRNFERWSGVAFGNPRLLHFHTCGAYAPGEISWNVIDPTVIVDDTVLWEHGALHASHLPGGTDLLSRFPSMKSLLATPETDIGIRAAG